MTEFNNLEPKKYSQLTGFEPARAEPIGFRVQRLNHSATIAVVIMTKYCTILSTDSPVSGCLLSKIKLTALAITGCNSFKVYYWILEVKDCC